MQSCEDRVGRDRKESRACITLWKLPNTTHCSLLPSMSDCISIGIVLEHRCIKFIWSCLSSYNTIIKTTALSAISGGGSSTFGDNYRYLSYEYNIGLHI